MFHTNTHIHTPYSFSTYDTVERMVSSAKEEGIVALGINDVATSDGFPEFARWCDYYHVYPLFNIEFLVRNEALKKDKALRNAPSDAGFLYLCGKSLCYPLTLSADNQNLLVASWKKTQDHIWHVIDRLNGYLEKCGLSVRVDFNDVRRQYAKKIVHERHVAHALYDALVRTYPVAGELEAALTRLSLGEDLAAHRGEPAWIQNELHARLLVGNPSITSHAHKEHYMHLREALALVLDAGGIPCYSIGAIPVNRLSECENDALRLADILEQSRIHAVDFFPLRTELEILKAWVSVFYRRGFCITFGTGHNTPHRLPFVPQLYGNQPLDDSLLGIGWEGACILAAHQEMRKVNRSGFVDHQGVPLVNNDSRPDFIAIGEQAIRKAALV